MAQGTIPCKLGSMFPGDIEPISYCRVNYGSKVKLCVTSTAETSLMADVCVW